MLQVTCLGNNIKVTNGRRQRQLLNVYYNKYLLRRNCEGRNWCDCALEESKNAGVIVQKNRLSYALDR